MVTLQLFYKIIFLHVEGIEWVMYICSWDHKAWDGKFCWVKKDSQNTIWIPSVQTGTSCHNLSSQDYSEWIFCDGKDCDKNDASIRSIYLCLSIISLFLAGVWTSHHKLRRTFHGMSSSINKILVWINNITNEVNDMNFWDSDNKVHRTSARVRAYVGVVVHETLKGTTPTI